MNITISNKKTGKKTTLSSNIAPDNTDVVMGLNGRLYQLEDDGACGDPECCGYPNYYYVDVTDKYEIEIEP